MFANNAKNLVKTNTSHDIGSFCLNLIYLLKYMFILIKQIIFNFLNIFV